MPGWTSVSDTTDPQWGAVSDTDTVLGSGMATYNKFSSFAEALSNQSHDLFGTAGSDADVCKIYFSATEPSATLAQKSDLAEISAGNGYTSGGLAATNVGTRSETTTTVVGSAVSFQASGGVGPFRYLVLYNSSTADNLLIGWWDLGESITMGANEVFTFQPDSATTGALFTLI